MATAQDISPQDIPANVYRAGGRLMISAPMPGLEPQDIAVDVEEGRRLVLHGNLRGALKDGSDVIADEWTPGPYHRELSLPADVDGPRANVTYSNGVLVVALPLADRTSGAHLELQTVGATRGERVGNRGQADVSSS